MKKNQFFSVSASWLGGWLGRMGQLEWRDTHETTCPNMLYPPEFVYQISSQSDEDYQSYSILHFWLVGWLVGWLVDMSQYFKIVFRQ